MSDLEKEQMLLIIRIRQFIQDMKELGQSDFSIQADGVKVSFETVAEELPQ